MLYSRLISDNPYRLLGIGSSAPYRELLAKALSAEKSARVGLAPEPGLADIFGAGRPDAGTLVSTVRSLANNPVALTTYRLAWMLEYPPAGLREESLPGLCRLVEESFSETPTYWHLCFLVGWWAFLQAPSPATLDKTLSALTEWYEDGAFDEHFTSVLARDNGDLGSARDVLYEAQNSLIDHILQVGTTHAEDRWNAGDTAESIALLRVICNSWPDPEQLHRALKRVADLGERERARIDNLCRSFEGWTTASPMYDVGEVRAILELAVVLGDYLPAAALWRTAVERRIDQVSTAMRGCAIDLANDESDYAAARRILEHLQELPLTDDWETRLAEDLGTLSGLEAEVARQIDQVATAARSIALELANDKSDYDAARKVLERLHELPLNDDWNTIVAQDLQKLREMDESMRASGSHESIVRCKSCGQMNRIPANHTGAVPCCGKCREVLGASVSPPAIASETGAIGLFKRYSPGLVLLALIGVIMYVVSRPVYTHIPSPPVPADQSVSFTYSPDSSFKSPTGIEVPADQSVSFTYSPLALPNSGSVQKFTRADAIAPFEITTPEDNHYLIKLVDADKGSPILTVFVLSGSMVKIDVPVGTYEVRYACGKTWYGYEHLFGPDTSYSKADTTFSFEIVGNQIRGHTLTLYKVENGNLSTSTISGTEF